MIRMFRVNKKTTVFILLFLFLSIANATGSGKIYWGATEGKNAVVYIQSPGEITSVTAQAGTEVCANVSQQPISALSDPVETVVMLDNSLSIPTASRSLITNFLNDLVGARIARERFTIACVSDKVNYLCTGETDYTKLKSAIGSIQYVNQETYITDVMYEMLVALRDRKDGIFKRVIVISDGVDNKEIGYTREELYNLMTEVKYPIYAIGCRNNTAQNSQELENFYSIARRTAGGAYQLEQNSLDMVNAVTASNQAYRIEAEIPNNMCDGTQKGVRFSVQTADGNTTDYALQLSMPFADVVESKEPAPAPIPESALVEEKSTFQKALPFIIAGITVIGIIAVIILLVKRKNKWKYCPTPSPQTDDVTVVIDPTEDSDSMTESVFGDTGPRTLTLTDTANSLHHFEVAINGEIAVGRAKTCQICISFDNSVSRHQCSIYTRNGLVMISNKSQSNVTLLNGSAITEDRELLNGSTIKMGYLTMKAEIK